MMGAKRHPNQYLQNSRFSYPLRLDANHTLDRKQRHPGLLGSLMNMC